MSNPLDKIMTQTVSNQKEASELLGRLLDVANVDRVYGEPVTQGQHTVITASEVTAAMGVGFGSGGGGGPDESGGGGGGGAGGGAVAGRPVAAIIIGDKGVRVEPVVDVTKIALGFFTAFGTMFVMLRKMKRGASPGS